MIELLGEKGLSFRGKGSIIFPKNIDVLGLKVLSFFGNGGGHSQGEMKQAR